MIFKREEPTFDTKQTSQEQNWRAYLSSFTRITATEGVPAEKVRMPFIKRDAPLDEDEQAEASHEVKSEESLTIRIALEKFNMVFEPNTSEFLIKSDKVRTGGKDGLVEAEQERENRASLAKEKIVMNNAWMKDLSKDVVDGRKQKFTRMVADGGDVPATSSASASSAAAKEEKAAAGREQDTEMDGA